MKKRDKNKNKERGKDARPTITRRDLERQVAEAGSAAVQEVSGKPADPAALIALAGTGRPDVVAGIDIHRPALNSLVAWEQWIGSEAAKKATPVIMLAATAYAYLQPDAAIAAMAAGDAEMHAEVVEFSRNLDVPALRKITAIIRNHIGELFDGSGDADTTKKNENAPPKPSPSGRRK